MKLLNEIQQKLKVPKGQFNSFSKFYYRNAEDILEAVKPLLGDAVLILTDEVVQVGSRNYVKATAELRVEGEHEKYCEVTAWRKGLKAVGSAKPDCGCGAEKAVVQASGWACESEEKKGMDAAQITGAASSYARKYALNGLFCIDDTKDADNDEAEGSQTRQDARSAKKYDYPAHTPKNDASGLLEAPRASKTEKEKVAEKLRVMDLVDTLKGRTTKESKPPKSLAGKIYSNDVFELVGMSLASDDMGEIGDALAKLLETSK